MKAPRLLSLLLQLQASGRVSASKLARELEVSERTIYRDVDALAQSGVPVYAERGRLGGIVLSEGYRRALMQLDADDLRSLLVIREDPLADLGFGDRRARITRQLLAALPDGERETALQARRRVLVDQRRWYAAPQPSDHLRALREASWADRRVRIEYRDRAGTASSRDLDPLGLVSKTGVWYLVGRREDAYRTFRVDRIVTVETLPEHFERPPEFDLDAYWNDSTRRLEAPWIGYVVTVRIAPHKFTEAVQSIEHTIVDREACIVAISFASAPDAAWRLFGWGDDAEVLGPPEFIDALVRHSRAIVERYSAQTRPPARTRRLPL
jgi:predicted DNA-binding transcriptional regulator YafY